MDSAYTTGNLGPALELCQLTGVSILRGCADDETLVDALDYFVPVFFAQARTPLCPPPKSIRLVLHVPRSQDSVCGTRCWRSLT